VPLPEAVTEGAARQSRMITQSNLIDVAARIRTRTRLRTETPLARREEAGISAHARLSFRANRHLRALREPVRHQDEISRKRDVLELSERASASTDITPCGNPRVGALAT
jgi:hypothetical protein